MFIKQITFEELKALLVERIGQPGMPSQAAVPNTLSALASFLGERRIAITDVVGSTLRLSFYRERDKHLATLRAAGRPLAYVRNRGSLLGHWHKLIRALDHEAALQDRAPTPLQVGLRNALEGRRFKRTAKEAGMSPQTLRRWMSGTLPRPGTDHYLSRLEEVCGLPPRALTDLLPYNAVNVADSGGYGAPIEYRLRLAKQTQDRYKLRAACAIETLRTEWRALLAYKTSAWSGQGPGSSAKLSALEQLRGALAVESSVSKKQWRLVPPDRSEFVGHDRWVDLISGQFCATAALVFNYAAGFMGWAQLPVDRGGHGLSAESAQTLGLFCDQDLIGAFVEWRVARSEGINGWIMSFLAFAAMLLNPETGFLTTQPDIAARNGFSPAAWIERCKAAHAWVNAYKRKIGSLVMPSRDPKDAIRHSLELAMPLTNFTLAIRRMETRWPTTGGEAEAIHARDLLLLALLTSNPLRALNLRRLTYYPDNTGQLRQTPSGEWRIVIVRHSFKNTKGAGSDYDQAVDESVWPHIRRYLKDYRKMIGGSRPELVFVSTVDPNRAWGTGLNRRFEALTRRYVPGCPGVGPHAMRHIVASSLIMQGGGSEASVARAARALRDSPATVRRHYSHLLASFGDRQHKEALGEILSGMTAKPSGPGEPPKTTS